MRRLPLCRRHVGRLLVWLLSVGLVACATGGPSAERQRVPAQILRPEQAGILLSEGREALERPAETLDRMNLENGDIVADIGAGNGWYSLRIAERVAPNGVVFAVEDAVGDRILVRVNTHIGCLEIRSARENAQSRCQCHCQGT